jgi:hypothetical protein
LRSLGSLEAYARGLNFEGYDPYDALSSPSLKSVKWKVPRVLATQVFVYSPINMRLFFGVPVGRNPKAIALFLRAYCNMSLENAIPAVSFSEISEELALKLRADLTPGYSGACWGFNFDWQDTTRMSKRGLPTIVVTATAANALLDLYEISKDEDYLQLAQSSCDFILRDLNITEDDKGICFSYTPIDCHIVHNANLLGAGLLARVHSLTGGSELLSNSTKAFDFSISRQEPDGSWAYSEDKTRQKKRNQIDFHQGFVLDSIMDFLKYSKPSNSAYEAALSKGAKFYHERQFDALGRCAWRYPTRWPIDIHNQAQGILTFSRLSEHDSTFWPFAKTIARWTIANMQDPKGYFYFQKYPVGWNGIPYMRWGQAWMMLALSQALRSTSAVGN